MTKYVKFMGLFKTSAIIEHKMRQPLYDWKFSKSTLCFFTYIQEFVQIHDVVKNIIPSTQQCSNLKNGTEKTPNSLSSVPFNLFDPVAHKVHFYVKIS